MHCRTIGKYLEAERVSCCNILCAVKHRYCIVGFGLFCVVVIILIQQGKLHLLKISKGTKLPKYRTTYIDLPSKTQSIQVISYSLSGPDHRYTDGAISNTQLAREIYPDWEVRVYHDNTVPNMILSYLKKHEVQLVNMSQSSYKNMRSWRFLVASDPSVRRYIIRDIDSRLSRREKAAVDDWIVSGKLCHVMRDHPLHNFAMMGGMWGCVHEALPNMDEYLRKANLTNLPEHKWSDTFFLVRVIWGRIKTSVLQHDAFFCDKYDGSVPFPTARVGWEFIGSIFINGTIKADGVAMLARGTEKLCQVKSVTAR